MPHFGWRDPGWRGHAFFCAVGGPPAAGRAAGRPPAGPGGGPAPAAKRIHKSV